VGELVEPHLHLVAPESAFDTCMEKQHAVQACSGSGFR
jgi:hypothetical protein